MILKEFQIRIRIGGKRVLMRINANRTIGKLQKIMLKLDVPFFFDMGTLLGIVREGRVLKHDLDIDIAVYANSDEEKKRVNQYLIENGYRLKYRYMVDDIGIVEESYVIGGIKFDVNYYRNSGDKDICYLLYLKPEDEISNDMRTVELQCTPISKISTLEFAGYNINVPENFEQYLIERYGENWRIPDKKYVYWKGNSATSIENVGHVVFGRL